MTDALPSSIKLSPIQREVLDQIVHVLTSTQDPVWPERAILLWGDGVSDSTTARELDVSEETVRILRHRWFSWMARIAAAEKKVHKAFAEIVSLIFPILSEEIAPETTLTAPVGSEINIRWLDGFSNDGAEGIRNLVVEKPGNTLIVDGVPPRTLLVAQSNGSPPDGMPVVAA